MREELVNKYFRVGGPKQGELFVISVWFLRWVDSNVQTLRKVMDIVTGEEVITRLTEN